ncbi:hypothetical protein AVEN_14041-1 [Araneus ventricosus]|uniref:Uncharacterized protein n=1 Tax=Araneus ventricosus TaxID=182803 RepID=A0A4Y2KS18_ARAVE|nr:hypothetical protein AVEN_14041-1 [Araneus ventricosus]
MSMGRKIPGRTKMTVERNDYYVPDSKESLSKRFWKLCRQKGSRVVTKVFMTRVEPFGKVVKRFASQQETRFSVRFLQAFITSLFGFPQA